MEEEGLLPNLFFKASITLITKPSKNNPRKKQLQANIPDENRRKNSQQNISK